MKTPAAMAVNVSLLHQKCKTTIDILQEYVSRLSAATVRTPKRSDSLKLVTINEAEQQRRSLTYKSGKSNNFKTACEKIIYP